MRARLRRAPQRPAMRRAEPFLIAAAREAQGLRHGYVGTEHMLLAVAGELGMSTADIEAEVIARVSPPAVQPGALDASLLATLGIDLEAVRRRVEQTFGPGALDRAAQPCLPVAPELKRALALAVARAGEEPLRASDVIAALSAIDCPAARILADRAA